MRDIPELAYHEYNALQAEKNGRIQARLQIWSIFLALIGALFIAGFQEGSAGGWALLLYPVAATFLAQFAGHNETIIDRLKRYLYHVEETYDYIGYEHFNLPLVWRSGSHKKALLGAFLSTEAAAALLGVQRVFSAAPLLLHLGIALLEVLPILATILVMWERKEP